MIITAYFTERLSATPSATVSTNRNSAVGTLRNRTIAARHTYIAVAFNVFDLAVGVHAFRESGITILPCASKNILQSPPLAVRLL